MNKDKVSMRTEEYYQMHIMKPQGIEIRRPTPYIVVDYDNIQEFAFFTETESRNIWVSVTIDGIFYQYFALVDEEVFNAIISYINNKKD